jgi:hypothetical protein
VLTKPQADVVLEVLDASLAEVVGPGRK